MLKCFIVFKNPGIQGLGIYTKLNKQSLFRVNIVRGLSRKMLSKSHVLSAKDRMAERNKLGLS